MPIARSCLTAACAAVAVAVPLALGGSALAAGTADTTITVSPSLQLVAPAVSPTGFPGVPKVRKGVVLPRGWVVVSRDVKITAGAEPGFAALRMTCPKGKTWRTGASTGDLGANVLDRNAIGKHSVLVMATYSTAAIGPGQTAAGTILALCR